MQEKVQPRSQPPTSAKTENIMVRAQASETIFSIHIFSFHFLLARANSSSALARGLEERTTYIIFKLIYYYRVLIFFVSHRGEGKGNRTRTNTVK